MDESDASRRSTASLPIAGRTGTLHDRMRGTAARDACRAKTGTLSNVSALAGYCETRDGGRVAFAFLMNCVYPWRRAAPAGPHDRGARALQRLSRPAGAHGAGSAMMTPTDAPPRSAAAALAAALLASRRSRRPRPRRRRDRPRDGTPIVTSFHPAEGLAAGQQGADDPDDPRLGRQPRRHRRRRHAARRPATVGAAPLRKAGFNVLTWDSRGFGQSGGTVTVDHKDNEGRDVQALLDYLAKQPEAQLDGPGDPRVGHARRLLRGRDRARGGRHRAADRRDRARHRLALAADLALQGGDGQGRLGGSRSTAPACRPPGWRASSRPPACRPATSTRTSPPRSSPARAPASSRPRTARGSTRAARASLVDAIRVPTLLIQGTADTLFTLDEAMTNYRILRGNGVPGEDGLVLRRARRRA